MSARLVFQESPDGNEWTDYVGKACSRGGHDECPGGFGVREGFLCGGPGAGPIVSTTRGVSCACGCHGEATS